eukprot:TRINITY_DN2828_c0_g1_i3.p1 TRINITY_DN2828_c0_g1~~TRINITY_DN2828_c0_g1_i3.p1  ORF type:complete len:243 (+),score=66.41 TRINITY_DN2828_c0_g1_i3:153-881(+)
MSRIVVRRSAERGHANHGWLDSYHTFSFANYHNPKFEKFGCLRVINEDRVSATNGFPSHPHKEFEIFSYILEGQIEHKDSMGNKEIIEKGGIQFTSAGTGIVHSEYNASKTEGLHFLQMWVKPNVGGLKPSYATKITTEEEKRDKLAKIISSDGSDGSILIHNDINIFASLLSKGVKVVHQFGEGRQGYLHVAQNGGAIKLNGEVLQEGDGAFINDTTELCIEGVNETSELILFDMNVNTTV